MRNRARHKRKALGTGIRRLEPPEKPAPFKSNDAVIEAARQMFRARQKLIEAEQESEEGGNERRRAVIEEKTWKNVFHGSFRLTGKDVVLCQRCRKVRLNRFEREIVMALLLDKLGLIDEHDLTCRDMIAFLGVAGEKVVGAIRSMSDNGRLFKKGLISYDDQDEDLGERQLIIDPQLVDTVLYERNGPLGSWPVKSEKDLYRHLSRLTWALQKRSNEMQYIISGCASHGDLFKASRKVERLLSGLGRTLELHPKWKFHKLKPEKYAGRQVWSLPFGCQAEWIILLALLGKELGHTDADDSLFTGVGLARAAGKEAADVPNTMKLLMTDQSLIRDRLIQPCGGHDDLLTNDAHSLADVEFELTEKTIGVLGIEKSLIKKRDGDFRVRPALMRMDQLVLAQSVRASLDMAVAQAKHANVLVTQWGLGETIAYGRAVTLLFSGPPGTGKTACAEAVAHSQNKPILVADYSQIQNCFVGQTEKNIAKVFSQARAHGAVLFWDEADAMFYDRDSATHNWEVRDVNVLLQQIERFDGICILATNRKITLDPALERRISLKIEFERPDRAMRRRIWEQLLPKKLPLEKNVDLDTLSCTDLSGGEIKNVILNAARLALVRGAKGPVTQMDFTKAVEMEKDGQWGQGRKGRMGFAG